MRLHDTGSESILRICTALWQIYRARRNTTVLFGGYVGLFVAYSGLFDGYLVLFGEYVGLFACYIDRALCRIYEALLWNRVFFLFGLLPNPKETYHLNFDFIHRLSIWSFRTLTRFLYQELYNSWLASIPSSRRSYFCLSWGWKQKNKKCQKKILALHVNSITTPWADFAVIGAQL